MYPPEEFAMTCRFTVPRVAVLILAWMLSAHPAVADSIRIMPVGDSDTEGYGGFVSYRYDLWFMLREAGYDVDFVGQKGFPGGGVDSDLYPRYEEIDKDHEGSYGSLIENHADLARAMTEANQPDVVLFLNSHDICEYGANATAAARFDLPRFIDNVRAVKPNVHFLLGQAYAYQSTFCDPNLPEIIPEFNAEIAAAAAMKDSAQSRVLTVDHYTGFDIDTMFAAGRGHANRAGEMFIAENWFDALEDVLPLVEPSEGNFNINAGHSGAWFNPDTSGQGQLIDIEPESQFMFLSWFTYTDAGSAHPSEQHWLTAQGNYEGNTAILPVYDTVGGKFDDPAEVSSTLVGSIEIEFDDCTTGQATYTIDSWGTSGSIPLSRVIPDSENVCLASSGDPAAAVPALEQNDGWDGAWFDPATSGQGFLIDSQSSSEGDDFIFVAWFTYGESSDSGQRWLTAQGPLTNKRAEISVYETTGGSFNNPAPVNSEAIGAMTIEFIDCNNARLTYDLTDETLSGSIDIVRLIPGAEALCESLAGSD
jgi:hypothetical protein